MQEHHPLVPFLPACSTVLMLGSFPPPQKRWVMDFYYPNFNNDMWRIIGLVFFDDKDYFIDGKGFKEALLKGFLSDKGIAIHDVAQSVIRQKGNASDKFLTITQKSDIAHLLDALPNCTHLVTTGERATQVLLEDSPIKIPKVGQSAQMILHGRAITLHRLPSSSRAYPLSLDKKAAFYRQAFEMMGLINHAPPAPFVSLTPRQ